MFPNLLFSVHSSIYTISPAQSVKKKKLPSPKIIRNFVRWTKGTAFNDVPSQSTTHPPVSHLHSSGHSIATLAGRINNHNQNIRGGVANSSDTNTSVSLDGMASCCNLQRERGTDTECYWVCCEGLAEGNIQTLWRVTVNYSPDPHA